MCGGPPSFYGGGVPTCIYCGISLIDEHELLWSACWTCVSTDEVDEPPLDGFQIFEILEEEFDDETD
jgi:hypothetical protein